MRAIINEEEELVKIFLESATTKGEHFSSCLLSGHFSQKQAKMKVVKIKNPDFSYWALSPP